MVGSNATASSNTLPSLHSNAAARSSGQLRDRSGWTEDTKGRDERSGLMIDRTQCLHSIPCPTSSPPSLTTLFPPSTHLLLTYSLSVYNTIPTTTKTHSIFKNQQQKSLKSGGGLDAQIADISAKIEVERKVLTGASAMYRQLADPQAREACEANMVESKRRLEYLEGLLRDAVGQSMSPRYPIFPPKASGSNGTPTLGQQAALNSAFPPQPRTASGSTVNLQQEASSVASRSPTPSIANLFKFGKKDGSSPNLAPERSMPDLNGSYNNGGAITPQPQAPQTGNQVSTTFDLMKYGTAITGDKVKHRLQEILHKLDTEQKVKTGTENLLHAMMNLNSAASVDQRVAVELRDKMAESNAKIGVLEKAKHRYSALYVAPVGEEEEDTLIGGMLLGLVWFKLGDLEDDLRARYPNGVPSNVNDVEDTWLDLEHAGQILIRLEWSKQKPPATKSSVEKPSKRPSPETATNSTQSNPSSTNAVCNEFSGSGTQWYQCQGCLYTCHAKCYPNVITKCITPQEIRNAKPDQDLNTGQLLSYRIPHRFQPKTILLSSWCAHCGSMMGPGARIEKCAECGKCAHTSCKPMVPNFCQLKPEMAIQLVAAFEDAERKKHAKEWRKRRRLRRFDESMMLLLRLLWRRLSTLRTCLEVCLCLFTDVVVCLRYGLDKEPEGETYLRDKLLENAKQLELLHLQQQREQQDAQQQRAAEEERRRRQAEDDERRKQFELQQRRLLEERRRQAELEEQRRQQQQQVGFASRNVKLEDFDFLAVLGRGAFGKVMLIEEKSTKQLYAMKALKKEFIIQSDDVASAMLEKRIFQKATQSQHPFLVNLHSCFQSDTRLYFVMEYISGGDLMCHIQEKKRFSQVRAKFYACEVLLALDFFHKNNIIYRDLKLDNIVMCPDGHIKVIDYGICKENMPYGQLTRTYCGTPDYMAPEILNQSKYSRAVDWWSFGVLIYVMLVGRVKCLKIPSFITNNILKQYPFHGDDESDILEAIVSDAIEYPSNMPKETLGLIQGLLKKDPRSRLGGGKLDAEEVKRHPYFAGVDWDLFMEKKVAPPWKPVIKSERDVSNFDAEFTKEKPILTPVNTVLSAVHQAEFKEFDFTAEWAGQLHH
ncbi:kinase-like protein [Rhizoclosmatium globosum]|uniref:protein kinase C n=1 Tax=Rhizoclosmatium globosum TaxID=329046 RepID=A0A1Y2AQ63_9FUNG|nr:kinase-like protein [Rhizoclosmatium globosum]|eukprot:ORY24440.1 kinase-like protein [Rhizoclosmatium globosum]